MIFQKILNIISGTINNICNRHQEISNPRLKICFKCKYKKRIKNIGNFCRLCGCLLESKTTVESEHCVINKW